MEIYSQSYEGERYTLTEEKRTNGRNLYIVKANGKIISQFEADNKDVAISQFESIINYYF